MSCKRELLVSLLVAAGIYSFGNAAVFVKNMTESELNKLLPAMSKELPEKALYANAGTAPAELLNEWKNKSVV